MSAYDGKISFGEMLDKLRAVRKPNHPDSICINITDGEVRYLADLVRIRRRHFARRLLLTPRQTAWLSDIYFRIMNEIKMAPKRRPLRKAVNMKAYSIGY